MYFSYTLLPWRRRFYEWALPGKGRGSGPNAEITRIEEAYSILRASASVGAAGPLDGAKACF